MAQCSLASAVVVGHFGEWNEGLRYLVGVLAAAGRRRRAGLPADPAQGERHLLGRRAHLGAAADGRRRHQALPDPIVAGPRAVSVARERARDGRAFHVTVWDAKKKFFEHGLIQK